MYSLVEDTPTKKLGEELEKLINEDDSKKQTTGVTDLEEGETENPLELSGMHSPLAASLNS